MYASFLGISGALHLGIFQQPAQVMFFSHVLEESGDKGFIGFTGEE
jgi:hypothetical protein